MQNSTDSIIILGSTGSVGEQAIDVARFEKRRVTAISANSNVKRVEQQAREFSVDYCAMADEKAAADLKVRLADTNVRVLSGEEGICEMISRSDSCVAVNSIIGQAGLKPTLAVIENKKRLALANKESLVVAGDIVMTAARKNNVEIIPVDSEHCAIFQCMKAGTHGEVKKILLTASGGPFYGKSHNDLSKITVEEALAHPTWKMGPKITVDSATLMNKGFEVIEAVHLFDVSPENIEVVIHKESIIHSMVEYIDNSIIAQMSVPDMRFCVQYALNYPNKNNAIINELDLFSVSTLNFGKPDYDTFPLLSIAISAIKTGGAAPAVLNAANEVAVDAFLNKKISFSDIMKVVKQVVNSMSYLNKTPDLNEILAFDSEARLYANEIIKSLKF
ncbi:MAG: 1-deoxy-D-xylulose-5-phosphate reductoisomerase [Clostridia bacterium]|nr:1-deoxy-D-xylulose-5-phosphate reductoisomerase [Clostridia bacterium]